MCFPLFLSRCPDEKEKAKASLEELQIKKVKKKKKKKHKEGEKHKRVKMYHRSCQTICAGLLLLPSPSPSPSTTSSSSAADPAHNSALSPFKSPLPVHPSPNNKASHLQPSSPPLAQKSLFNSSHHEASDSTPSSPLPVAVKPAPRCAHPGVAGLEFGPYIHIEQQPNGGALVAHAYTSQLSSLTMGQRQRFAQEFVTLAFSEDSSLVRLLVYEIEKRKEKLFIFSQNYQHNLNVLFYMFSRQLIMSWGSSTERPATCRIFWITSQPSSHQLQSRWKYWQRRT